MDADYGNLTVTYFDNLVTPLIRYQIGDGVSINNESCECGLPYDRFRVIDGRLSSMVLLPCGEEITSNMFPHVFKDYEWIERFQVEQTSAQTLIIRVKRREERFSEDSFRDLNSKLSDILGMEMELEWRYNVPFLDVPTGKHIYFINSMDT